MNAQGLILIAFGIFTALGGICNWEWFMNHYKARFLTAILTRTGARAFYILIGIGLFIGGIAITLSDKT